MFCPKCGKEIDSSSVFCPHCSAQVNPSITPDKKIRPQKDDNPRGKGFAAIVSALFVFPTLICLAFDYLSRDNQITWSAYVLGITMCLWMFIALPALKPKRPALTVSLCLGVISLYMAFLAYINHNAGIYVKYILPMVMMIIVSSAVLSLLISYNVIKKEHIISAVCLQAGLLMIGFEILFDIRLRGTVNLRWSIITSVVAISAIALNEAISYSVRIGKKK